MKANRRSLIMRSGMELFSRYGYRDVSVEDIVRAAGLSVGTFYKHFRSKETFYDEILRLIQREGIRKAEEMVARLHSPINKLKAVYQFVLLGMRRYPILRGVLQGDERFLYPGIDVGGGGVGVLRARIEEILGEIIRDGSRRNIFRPGLYNDAHAMVMVLLDTVIVHLDDRNIEAISRDILTLLQRGLRRTIRLRRRAERLDRRIIQDDEGLDWFET
ncbi:MAG: helix-turn-helix domain containing protein [Spirochaeta sp.]|nr:helix-turn-helix domain containing protein [Spirochaeta sp.]